MQKATRPWTWGQFAPDSWFEDRERGSILVRGYLAVESGPPPASTSPDGWPSASNPSDVVVGVIRDQLEIPAPITVHYVGDGQLAHSGGGHSTTLPPGTYVVFATPIQSVVTEVSPPAERDARARIDSAAGLVGAVLSMNAVYQEAFEFLAAASGPAVQVFSPSMRTVRAPIVIDADAIRVVSEANAALGRAKKSVRDRARTALRWYAQSLAEQDRVDAFVKLWVALEALCFSANGSPKPLTTLLANYYACDERWIRDTFSIDSLAQLRSRIVHSGERPMPHGNLMTFVDALFIDALRERLGLPNERRAENALPAGQPLRVSKWTNTGSVVTLHRPAGPMERGEHRH